jgi:hypothetical protein
MGRIKPSMNQSFLKMQSERKAWGIRVAYIEHARRALIQEA